MPKEPTITPPPAPNSQQPVNASAASAAPAATPPESSQPATPAAGAEPTPEPPTEKLFPDSQPIYVPPAPVTREEFDALLARVERLEKLPSIACLLNR